MQSAAGHPIESMLRAAGFSGRYQSIGLIPTGMMNAVYRVRMDEMEVILRVRTLQDPEYGQEFSAERFAYPLLPRSRVAVPELIFAQPDSGVLGWPFAVFEFIRGETLNSAAESLPTLKTLLGRLASSLAAVHSVRGAWFGTLTKKTHEPSEGRIFLSDLLANEAVKLEQHDQQLGVRYKTWLACVDGIPIPHELAQPTLVHGDMHFGNAIRAACDDVFLIDWESARYRMAPYDFAKLQYQDFRNRAHLWDWFVDCYLDAANRAGEREQFLALVWIFRVYVHVRMATFFLQFPTSETDYHGNANAHLRAAWDLIADGPRLMTRRFNS